MKIIDLSGEYTEKMWYYGEPYTPYSVKDLACVDKNGYIAREYTLTAHTGTHIENSAHWSENAQGISETLLRNSQVTLGYFTCRSQKAKR